MGWLFLLRDGICCSFYEDLGEGSGCSLNVSWVIVGGKIYLGCMHDIDLILADVSPMPLESVWQLNLCECTGFYYFLKWDCGSDYDMSGRVEVVPW